MQEYKILVGKATMDMWDATIKNIVDPSDNNKKRLEKLHEENRKSLDAFQREAEIKFIGLYGEDTLAFIKRLKNREYFLVGSVGLISLSWDVKSDENDNYWTVSFYRGKFSYRLLIAGGYGGVETLEENISHERVLELLNIKNKNQ